MLRRLVCVVSVLAWVVACDESEGFAGPDDLQYGDAAYNLDNPHSDAGTPAVDGSASANDAATTTPESDASTLSAESDASTPSVESDASSNNPVPCTPRLWYRDADADGFGSVTDTTSACYHPGKGWTTNHGDCFDGNALARPGSIEMSYHDRGDGSFDYDCDGVESMQYTARATCPLFTVDDYKCPPTSKQYPSLPGDNTDVHCYEKIMARIEAADTEGWWSDVPKCGEQGKFGIAVRYSRDDATGYTCNEPSARPQLCR